MQFLSRGTTAVLRDELNSPMLLVSLVDNCLKLRKIEIRLTTPIAYKYCIELFIPIIERTLSVSPEISFLENEDLVKKR